MGESGKRPRRQREHDEDKKIHKRRINDKDERGNDELVVYRILCPDEVIGSVIGKNGKVINSIRQETRAKVKVVDPFPGAKERVITIYCYVKEKVDVDVEGGCSSVTPLCSAQDALLKVHAAISNAIASNVDPEMNTKDKEECQILVPSSQSSNIIGKAGMTIKKLRSKTRSSIKVIAKDVSDPSHACAMDFDNFIMSPDDLKSMAVEAVLLLQEKINDEDEDTVRMRMLIASKVIGCIIGKSGSIISEIRKRTNADIRISKGDKPKCAEVNDELVELQGEVGCVRDAIVQIILRLRDDVLKDRDSGHSSATAEPFYSGAHGLPVTSFLHTMPPMNPLGYDRRAEAGMLSSGSLQAYGPLSIGENGYGSISSYSSSKLYGGLSQPSTIEMLVPANTVGKVLGKGGMNIANIRKISGAVIEISESKSGRGDRIAHISGTSEQRISAENLIQAFIMAT
ncbi:KH domain-containing protein At4g18375 [Linum perenne]